MNSGKTCTGQFIFSLRSIANTWHTFLLSYCYVYELRISSDSPNFLSMSHFHKPDAYEINHLCYLMHEFDVSVSNYISNSHKRWCNFPDGEIMPCKLYKCVLFSIINISNLYRCYPHVAAFSFYCWNYSKEEIVLWNNGIQLYVNPI